MSDQEEDVPCLCRIYLESGQTIETAFEYLEWDLCYGDFQSMSWKQSEEFLKKCERELDRTLESVNVIDANQIAAITTIKEFE